ncbi:MAG: tyrosine-type recombinase/integrase [Terriglobales bacterium]
MAKVKRVRIIKKIRVSSGVWKFASLKRAGSRYAWDARPGVYFVEWWDGPKRWRESAGTTPSEAMEAQRRKRNEIAGEAIYGGRPVAPGEAPLTSLVESIDRFLEHVRVHSPDKPRTVKRYTAVFDHVKRILGRKTFVEAITRADIDEYKTIRSGESSEHRDRKITARTINFEVCVFRTFFYYLIRERNLKIENPCANFKPLKDPKAKAKRRPPVYRQEEIDAILAKCDARQKAIFATLLLAGLREEELCFLTWADLELGAAQDATIRVGGEGKKGFSPKDYEERMVPIPAELVELLKALPRKANWVFPTTSGGRETHLLRALKSIAKNADVADATLHKFRHTYATRLLESGADIVTVQRLMGHSDLDTTRQYLDPDVKLKRSAVSRLSLSSKESSS